MIKTKDVCLEAIVANPLEVSPATYQYYKGLENRRIIINDQIDAGIVETLILPLLEMDNDGSGEPIEIVLSSPGGSVYDALCACNIIDNLKTPTTIKVLGYAFSMAGLLLAAGYNNPNVKKVCYKFSTALLHAGSTYLEGSANIVKDTFHFTEKMDEEIKKYMLSHSKMTEDEYVKMERYEWYMMSDEMLRLGLVDEIL